ncbi:RNA N6-adenosine-methyltransferase mettl16-like [Mytilus californianus]|uniref:RNA N6-adenosine-methyltransferase mettl16-like n=1 Tax=Mytilus californianus TaxID=6549 RepID=UPI0022455054|nr:RNA N6-adenosine-methyltransferase mettl16-like [Mytilus californianus]
MALNKFMHPRNKYKNKKANFQYLAIKYPEFRKHVYPDVSGKLFLDFRNPDSLRQLSTTLMKEDFGLDVVLPPDRLVPTIPLRLNYILWIEDILKDSSVEGDISGIDVGTGGSCVYPLLSARMNKWRFLATELDDTNFTCAVKNVERNQMTNLIQVQKVEKSAVLLDVLKVSAATYTFCMCNPPFFMDNLEAQGITNTRSDDRPEPHSVCTASPTESVAFGGEVEFVKKMIHESLELKTKVRVYTSMVGKKTSLSPLKEELRKLKILNFSTTEFCQGKTMRWGLGWSFDETIKFPKSEFKEKRKERRPPLSYVVPEDTPGIMYTTEGVAYQIKEYLKQLQIKCEDKKSNEAKISMVLTAYQNTWSNQRKKRRHPKDKQLQEHSSDTKYMNTNNSNDTTQYAASLIAGETFPVEKNQANLTEIAHKGVISVAGETSPVEKNQANLTEIAQKFDISVAGNTPVKRKRKGSGSSDSLEAKIQKTEGNSQISEIREMIQNADGSMDNIDTSMNGNKVKSESIDLEASSSSGVNIKRCETTAENLLPTSSVSNNQSENSTLLKCNLYVKQIEDEMISIEMSWIDGTCRESMNQVLQYFKNKLKVST